MEPVSTVTSPPLMVAGNRSMPRGAGPPGFSPSRLYWLPWHGHSNHCEESQLGTRQPRCGHFWYSVLMPAFMPTRIGAAYTFSALGRLSAGYAVTHMRASGT